MKKILVVGVILLFLGSGIPAFAHSNETNVPLARGHILYVGGSGPGNYSKIQDAINNATNGSTIFVYANSSPYYEFIFINKRINLIGENKETTIINGEGGAIIINKDDVNLSGFTIRGNHHIIDVSANNCIIQNNIIIGSPGDSCEGIFLWNSSHNIIYRNFIKTEFCRGSHGIFLASHDTYNTISENSFWGWIGGMALNDGGKSNNISMNTLKHCYYGISVDSCLKNTIFQNNITDTTWGSIAIYDSLLTRIEKNNLINATFTNSYLNYWNGNYWNTSKKLPVIIFGETLKSLIHWINIDWHPAKKPYDIPTVYEGMR